MAKAKSRVVKEIKGGKAKIEGGEGEIEGGEVEIEGDDGI